MHHLLLSREGFLSPIPIPIPISIPILIAIPIPIPMLILIPILIPILPAVSRFTAFFYSWYIFEDISPAVADPYIP